MTNLVVAPGKIEIVHSIMSRLSFNPHFVARRTISSSVTLTGCIRLEGCVRVDRGDVGKRCLTPSDWLGTLRR